MKKITSGKFHKTIITLLSIMMLVCGCLGLGAFNVLASTNNTNYFVGISGNIDN